LSLTKGNHNLHIYNELADRGQEEEEEEDERRRKKKKIRM